MFSNDERWPPTYDQQDLENAISELVKQGFLFSKFYDYAGVNRAEWSQGDIIYLEADMPLLNENAETVYVEHSSNLWLLFGNTCDIHRDNVNYTQIVPITDIKETLTQPGERRLYHSYKQYRLFYLPPWDTSVEDGFYVANFTEIATIDKNALKGKAKRLKSMSFEGWILLNSCIVRFLARDDGRNELE